MAWAISYGRYMIDLEPVDRFRFREGPHSDFLTLTTDSAPFNALVIGEVSKRDLWMSPSGNFNNDYKREKDDQTVGEVVWRLNITDPDIEGVVFTRMHDCLAGCQNLFDGNNHRYFLENNGGIRKVRLSAKVFTKVCRSITQLLLTCVSYPLIWSLGSDGPSRLVYTYTPIIL